MLQETISKNANLWGYSIDERFNWQRDVKTIAASRTVLATIYLYLQICFVDVVFFTE
jgi:hypothetical protein